MPRPISSDVRLKASWFDYCTSASDWTAENLVSLEIINLINSHNLPLCVSNIIKNNNLVVLALYAMDSDLFMFPHITQIGGIVRVKEPKFVALNVVGLLATVAQFKAWALSLGESSKERHDL